MPRRPFMDRRVKLVDLNEQICCKLCNGYLIDATTITECLHTFCKSCLVKFLEENNTCPICHLVIHQSHPLNYVGFDRTMQDIVYKLVPDLLQNEKKKERLFYESFGKKEPEEKEEETKDECITKEDEADCHRSDEQVKICLECNTEQLRPLRKKFIRISAQATINHIRKFVAKKLKLEGFHQVEILCNQEILGKDHTLKFVCVTRWRTKQYPLMLEYRPSITL
ncbi:polycomb group RING finger protein 3-like [Patiria miniata]|uniref:RING-type domain-containing protein n=1 Tax=Patiria miniata TaxID=46514 RepID=A0A913Z4W0_PATMI|nr:polycomb group RING finger protein 3-like [Patiria miniata]